MKISTQKIVSLALFIALAVVFRRVLNISLPFGDINFGGLPIILAGFIFGPLSGFTVGAVADIIGYPLLPQGAYFPHFTLSSALAGAIPALIYNFVHKDKKKPSFWLLCLSIFIGQFITSVLMVSYFKQILLNYPFKLSAAQRLSALILRAPVYAFICMYMMKAYNNYKGSKG